MRSPLPPRDGITAQRLRAPGGRRTHPRASETPPATVGEWLRADFPEASDAELEALTTRGELSDETGRRVTLTSLLIPGGIYFFHREFPPEERVPVEISVVHEDAELLVIDKPHFLASTPNGRFVRECAVTRLRVERGEPDLVAIHRLDRVTAGLLVLSRRPETRGAYQRLFQERRIRKTYRALAWLDGPSGAGYAGPEAAAREQIAGGPLARRAAGSPAVTGAAGPALDSAGPVQPVAEVSAGWAACRVSRLHKPNGGRQVVEVPGAPNARTEARLLRVWESAPAEGLGGTAAAVAERGGAAAGGTAAAVAGGTAAATGSGEQAAGGPAAAGSGRPARGRVGEFELHPHTGRTHQLRVHMNAWGMPLVGDPVYPVDLEPDPYDFSSPLQLLASRLEFRDPLSGEERMFESGLGLRPPME
ncbi:pseudouridine synthase [Brevibacterium sp.]|uniref:pseudouridine synthase n=1 Tax=Brevibacterium sp. TaxID=1701 RepID=UPI0025B8B763|nr:pseudouridine synthase [Brevibacterium sp.]